MFNDPELMKIWQSNFKGIQWEDPETSVILRGAVDEMLIKNGKLIVLDFKTRGYPLKEDTHEHYKDQMDIYNFLLRKNNYQTEEYTYLIFYHPHKVYADGHVCFNTDLIKIKVNIKNAENIFKKALKVLAGKMPKADEDCEYCKYTKERC